MLPGTINGRIRDIKMDSKKPFGSFLDLPSSKILKVQKGYNYNPTNYFETTSIGTSPDGTLWASSSTGELEKYNPATNSFSGYDMFQHSISSFSK